MAYTAFKHAAWNPLHSIEIHWATLHGIHCIQPGFIYPRCMECTAFNRGAFYHAAWSSLHSIIMHGIHCINRDGFYHAAWNPLHSVTLHGIHCSQSGSIVPHCRETTSFNRHPLRHAAWNPLHSTMVKCVTMDAVDSMQHGKMHPD